MNTDNPILNSPYHEPKLHYATTATGSDKGSLDYTKIVEGRRIFVPETPANPNRKRSPQEQIFVGKKLVCGETQNTLTLPA
jgi:type III restriction enzyme